MRAVELVEHVVAAEHDVVVVSVGAGRRGVAASVGATCLPTRELSDSDPATCSARHAGLGHRRPRAAVDCAWYRCSTGCSMALERGRPRSEMRMGYVCWPSTRGSRRVIAARCGGKRDIQPISLSSCRAGRTRSIIILNPMAL